MAKPVTPVFVRMTGQNKDITISNNVVTGARLLDAENATVENLTLTFNNVYGPGDAVKLGDVFGADISGNLFELRLPKEMVAEIKGLAKSEPKKNAFLQKIKTILTSPSEIEAIAGLAERAYRLL